MQIIIIGGGEIGYALAKTLASDHELCVLDTEPGVADRFGLLDVELLTGSGTSSSLLERARVSTCDLLIGCTGLDEVNIVACSIGSQLGCRRTICFVSKEDFVHTPEGRESLNEHFGIDQVVWPEAQLADAIERIIMAPGSVDAGVFVGGEIRLLEFRLGSDSPLVGRPISALDLPYGVVIVAVHHGETTSIPHGRTVLDPGDKVVLMGTRKGMKALQGQLAPDAAKRRLRRVTIIGGGDVGLRLAQHLDSEPGIQLCVVEHDHARGEMLAATLGNALILEGDGTDLSLLESEEIGRSDVLVSVIDNDERNLLACLIGRQLGVGSVITRVSTPANLRLFERVGIDVALSARGAAVASVLHQIDGGRSSLLAVLEEGQAKVIELTVPTEFPATALRNLGVPNGAIIGSIVRGGQVIVPRGEDRIEPGDHLLVCATGISAEQVRELFTTGSH
ncbi:MAG: Trk system potassium transporter TrkA [Acidobacteria bacterium]|nr:MAG: Trk system potassium transporter TrkA [Acidobacteriota bacterium]